MTATPEYSPKLTEKFHPDHLRDLARSGLSEETILALGIYSARPQDIPKLVGWDPPPAVTSVLVFPYPGEDEFSRVKVFPLFTDKQGRAVKYLQRPRSGVRLYLPDRVRAVLPDPDVPLVFTEGEKKAAALWQAGYYTIGLGGVWNWLEDGQPIAGLDGPGIAWVNRCVEIAFDSNIWHRPDLLRCAYALARECEDHGAVVTLRRIPHVEGRDAGADDYLVAHGKEAYAALETIPLDNKSLSRFKEWYKGWRGRKAPPVASIAPRELLDGLQERTILHFAQDVVGNHLVYGIPVGGRRLLLSSAGQLIPAEDLGKDVTLVDGGLRSPCFTKEAVKAFLDGQPEPTPALLGDLVSFLRRFLFLRPDGMYIVVATWALATYAFRTFRVFPYLIATSPTKRCGKTRLLELLHLLAFNPSPVQTNPTEAVLLREPEVSGGAILLDEMERLAKTDSERFGLLLSILHVGFTMEASVSRMEMVPGREPLLRPFSVFAPRAIATIARMAATLEDRSIVVQLPRRRPDEPLDRFSPRRLSGEAQALRDRSAIWALSHAGKILTRYEGLSAVEAFSGLDDRQQDLWEPLYVIADLAADEGVRSYRDALVEQAQALATGRREREAEASLPQLIEALFSFLGGQTEAKPTPTALRQHLAQQLGQAAPQTFPEMAALLQSLEVRKGWDRDEGTTKPHRAWFLKREHLLDLAGRYCTFDSPPESNALPEGSPQRELDLSGTTS